ncbi:MAG: DUF924 family protein [Caulobacteraceae bacterium]
MTLVPATIVRFWREAGPRLWFAKDPAFDAEIRSRFETVHHAAARGEHEDWAADPDGALALALLFDQFPRNIFRGSAHAFATDPLARFVARRSIEVGHDRAIEAGLRSFFYTAFMHSEDLADQDRGVVLFEDLEREGGGSAKWAKGHRGIIARFGRFPHRNPELGRPTTPEEQAFLDAGGFAG